MPPCAPGHRRAYITCLTASEGERKHNPNGNHRSQALATIVLLFAWPCVWPTYTGTPAARPASRSDSSKAQVMACLLRSSCITVVHCLVTVNGLLVSSACSRFSPYRLCKLKQCFVPVRQSMPLAHPPEHPLPYWLPGVHFTVAGIAAFVRCSACLRSGIGKAIQARSPGAQTQPTARPCLYLCSQSCAAPHGCCCVC